MTDSKRFWNRTDEGKVSEKRFSMNENNNLESDLRRNKNVDDSKLIAIVTDDNSTDEENYDADDYYDNDDSDLSENEYYNDDEKSSEDDERMKPLQRKSWNDQCNQQQNGTSIVRPRKILQSSTGTRNEEALAYLLRYETMIRQQEAEDMAVLAHLVPCLHRLEELVELNLQPEKHTNTKNDHDKSKSPDGTSSGSMADRNSIARLLHREIRYSDLKRVVDYMDKESGSTPGQKEFFTTDRQLMMVLHLLTAKSTNSYRDANDENSDGVDLVFANHRSITESVASVTWAEIIQCYKVCISGMVALQNLPKPTAEQAPSNQSHCSSGAINRARTRNRTIDMLSLFQPSPKYCGQYHTNSNKWNAPVQEQRAAILSSDKKLPKSTSSRSFGYRKMIGSATFLITIALTIYIGLDYIKIDQNEHGLRPVEKDDGNGTCSEFRSHVNIDANNDDSDSQASNHASVVLEDNSLLGNPNITSDTSQIKYSGDLAQKAVAPIFKDERGNVGRIIPSPRPTDRKIVAKTTTTAPIESAGLKKILDDNTYLIVATHTGQYHPQNELVIAPSFVMTIALVAITPIVAVPLTVAVLVPTVWVLRDAFYWFFHRMSQTKRQFFIEEWKFFNFL